jgi:hypothetical protein
MSMEVQTGGSECYPTPRGSEVDTLEVQTDESECYPTPRGSEVDALEYHNNVALWLYVGNCTGKVGRWRSHYWRQQLDTIPGAGEYYRALVQDHPLRDVVLMRYGAFLAGQAAREHTEEQQKNEGAYHQKKQKSKRHGS